MGVVAEAAVDAEATVLLVGKGVRADALARRLPRAGLVELERSGTDEVAQVARVTAPDLIVVAGDSTNDGGKRVLELLASDASLGQLPVIVIRESFNPRSPSSPDAWVAELAQGRAPALCALWIHALLGAIGQHGLDGRTLQQALDAITDASTGGTAPALRGGASSGAAPASGTRPALRGGASTGTAPTLLGMAPVSYAGAPPKSVSRRPSPVPEPQSVSHNTTSLSAFAAAAAADQPIATSGACERQSIPAPKPPSARERASSAAPTLQPRARATATARQLRRMPRVAMLAAAVGLVGLAAVALAAIIRGGSSAVPTASIGSVSTAVASGTRTVFDTAQRAPVHGDLGRAQPADGRDTPEPVRPDRLQAIAIANRYVGEGHQLLKHEKLQAAKVAYMKALRAFPEYPRALAGIVRLQLRRHDGAEAVRWAKRLIAVQPKRGNNRLLLGDAWAMHGDQTLARDAWRRAANYGNATARQRLRKAARSR